MITGQSKKGEIGTIMRENNKKRRWIRRISNRQFQKLFLKNWLQVFLCIALPLFLCTFVIQYYSSKNLLWEMDNSVQRSVRNTNATLETLFEEVCDTLEKEIVDSDISSFLQSERTTPVSYAFITQVNMVLELVKRDMRESLYYSVDAYSANSDFLVSVLYRGQSYELVTDRSLVSVFEEHLKEKPQQTMFAVPRVANNARYEKDVITVYRTRPSVAGKKSFVSVSVDIEKLIAHIVDQEIQNQGAYLIVDDNNRVVLDTSGEMTNQSLSLPKENAVVSTAAENINGRKTYVAWMSMNHFDWKCVQIIPMEEYQYNMIRQQRAVVLIILFGVIASILLSYGVTVKLFRPIEAILRLIENPSEENKIGDENDEIQYLLVRILELFQKNIALESEMLDRLHALRKARAKALQEQMTPHFLNNVLQTINWIAVEETGNEEGATSRAIVLLADIIDTGRKQKYSLTTVLEEIEYTRKFVALERMRYGKGIGFHYEIDSATEGMLIPCISLQTLVENSIAHGFRTRGGCGNIYVCVQMNEKGGLNIRVEDDGDGIDPEVVISVFRRLEQDDVYIGEHLGLINFFQRFLLIYGEECSFDIRKSNYGGACVEVMTSKLSMEWLPSMDMEKQSDNQSS